LMPASVSSSASARMHDLTCPIAQSSIMKIQN
jgi:hypothetical protein